MNAIVPLNTSPGQPVNGLPRTNIPIARERHTVKHGDTLSGIVREYLMANGRDHSAQAVYKGVQNVAQANHIANADRIFVGQRINVDISTPRTRESFPELVETVAMGMKSKEKPGLYAKVLNGPATISSPYGQRKHPVFNDQKHHNGIDLAAERNTPITSMRPGTVLFSGWQRGHGNTVIVQHDGGVQTQYSHASKRSVSKGDQVSSDTILGLVGSTGNSTGPHLHLEVKRNGRLVNPIPYLLTNPTPRTKLSQSI